MNFLLLPAEDLVVNTKARDKVQLVEHSRKEMIIKDVILTYYTVISETDLRHALRVSLSCRSESEKERECSRMDKVEGTGRAASSSAS
jgi:hypothetical protein